ncbi:hypothetical protein CK203_010033 [Vitis vinifera]|uniref:Uncharacterized protein n=1 Tax=Vitis vinifera TaxID=29760 RepID=A0A438JVF6_VITVI|nr:hypothetical protein CK203_010033 [Vitis vinifera]
MNAVAKFDTGIQSRLALNPDDEEAASLEEIEGEDDEGCESYTGEEDDDGFICLFTGEQSLHPGSRAPLCPMCLVPWITMTLNSFLKMPRRSPLVTFYTIFAVGVKEKIKRTGYALRFSGEFDMYGKSLSLSATEIFAINHTLGSLNSSVLNLGPVLCSLKWWSDDESKSEQFITCAAFPGLELAQAE